MTDFTIVTVQVLLLRYYEDHTGRPIPEGEIVRMPPGEAAFLSLSRMCEIIEGTEQSHPERRARPRTEQAP